MNKALLNYFIDIGMAIAFAVVLVTGILKLPAFGRAREYMLMHDIAGIVLAVFVLLHLILHWNWIKCMTKSCILKR